MNKKLWISSILGTIIIFIWNALSWMVLPLHDNALRTLPDEVLRTPEANKITLADGVYHYPGVPKYNSEEAMNTLEQKLQKDPKITLMVYRNAPNKPFDPLVFLESLVLNFISVIALLFVLYHTKKKSLQNMIKYSLAVAVILMVMVDFAQMLWFQFPLDYTLANIFDRLVSSPINGNM